MFAHKKLMILFFGLLFAHKKLMILFFGLLMFSHARGCSPRDVAEREGRFPYVVSIQDHDFGVNKSLCTGSIVAERFVVTAAHCILSSNGTFKAQRFQIVAGIRDLNSTSSDQRVVADVVEMFVPVEYRPELKESDVGDIAILKLSRDLEIEKNPNIGKIDLPVNNMSYTGIESTVIGFGWYNITKAVQYPETPGLVSVNGTSDGQMRNAKVKVFEYADCIKSYNETFRIPITRKRVCAQLQGRDPMRVEEICLGDGGDPLVHNHVLIGVANASPLTCRDDVQPSVYARVFEFTEFIQKVISGSIDETVRTSGTLTFEVN